MFHVPSFLRSLCYLLFLYFVVQGTQSMFHVPCSMFHVPCSKFPAFLVLLVFLYSSFKEASCEALAPDAVAVGAASRLGSTSLVLGPGLHKLSEGLFHLP